MVTHAGVGVLRDGNKTDAVNWLRPVGQWKACEFTKRREDVDRLGKLPGRTAWLRDFRKDNQNRNMVREGRGWPCCRLAQVDFRVSDLTLPLHVLRNGPQISSRFRIRKTSEP